MKANSEGPCRFGICGHPFRISIILWLCAASLGLSGCQFGKGQHGGGGGGGGGVTAPNSITITTTTLPNGSYGNSYSQAISATGGSGTLSYAIAGGALPPGLGLGAGSAPNLISGVPAQLGTFAFNLSVSDGAGHSTSAALFITVNGSAQLLGAGLPYAFQFEGYDSKGAVLMLGSFIPQNDGASFTGTVEINSVTAGATITSNFEGQYAVGSDGRGTLTVTSLPGSPVFAFAFDSVGNTATAIEFDNTGTRGTGFIQFQHQNSFAIGNIAGGYALRLNGQDQQGGPFGALGELGFDGTGTIAGTGVLDYNSAGVTSPAAGLAVTGGTYMLLDTTHGQGSMTLNCPSCPAATIHLSFYMIKGNKLLVMVTDPLSSKEPIATGVLRGQAGPFDNSFIQSGSTAFELEGVSAANASLSSAMVGEFTWNGSSFSGEEDSNDGGTLKAQTPLAITNVSVAANGRGSATLVDSTGKLLVSVVFYMINTDWAFVMESPGVEVRTGSFYPRSYSGPPGPATWIAGTEYPPAAGLTNSDSVFAFSKSGAISGDQDEDSVSGSGPSTVALAGTGTAPDANGRGTVTITSNGGLNGSTTAVYYLVSTAPPSALLMGTNTASGSDTRPVVAEAQQQ